MNRSACQRCGPQNLLNENAKQGFKLQKLHRDRQRKEGLDGGRKTQDTLNWSVDWDSVAVRSPIVVSYIR